MVNAVYISEGLFDDADGGRLIGNKCLSCGRIYFPQASFCFECFNRNMAKMPLSRRGNLYSYTTGYMASTRLQPPYTIGLVDLPEGIRVFAPLKCTVDQPLHIGMEMEIVVEELWQEDGNAVIGYRFAPA